MAAGGRAAGGQWAEGGPWSNVTGDIDDVYMVPLLPPVALRLLAVGPLFGATLPAGGGAITIRLSHEVHASADVRVTLHAPAVGGDDGSECPLLWARGYEVVCTAPPGAGTVYVHVSVDGQAAEAALPLTYAKRRMTCV